MLLKRIGSFLQQRLAGENKSLSVAGDEENRSSTLCRTTLLEDSCFRLEDTQLEIFDFCLGNESNQGELIVRRVLIEGSGSYVP